MLEVLYMQQHAGQLHAGFCLIGDSPACNVLVAGANTQADKSYCSMQTWAVNHASRASFVCLHMAQDVWESHQLFYAKG